MPTELKRTEEPVVNISEEKRMISGISGGILLTLGALGLGKSPFRRALRMTFGSWLIMRALTGYCPLTALKNSIEEKTESGTEPLAG
jgi:uncharacterized membrane protein